MAGRIRRRVVATLAVVIGVSAVIVPAVDAQAKPTTGNDAPVAVIQKSSDWWY
jgi:hypothetical protein